MERLFAKAKQFRRFATRNEKRKTMFLGVVHLVFGFLRLRLVIGGGLRQGRQRIAQPGPGVHAELPAGRGEAGEHGQRAAVADVHGQRVPLLHGLADRPGHRDELPTLSYRHGTSRPKADIMLMSCGKS